MPGKEGLAHKKGQKVLDQDTGMTWRELYLTRIREGYGRFEAAELIGVNYTTVWRYLQSNPDFVQQVQEAEANSVESVHRLYRELMEDPERDDKVRLSAAEKLERALGRYHKNDAKIEHNHKVAIEIGGDMMEQVLAMRERLALEQGDVIDVEGEER